MSRCPESLTPQTYRNTNIVLWTDITPKRNRVIRIYTQNMNSDFIKVVFSDKYVVYIRIELYTVKLLKMCFK